MLNEAQNACNQALWRAAELFRGSADPQVYQYLIMAMLFLKYLTDVESDLIALTDAPGATADFVLPARASFDVLHKQSEHPGNGRRIDEAFKLLEGANQHKLDGVFQDIRFDANWLGDEAQKDDTLRKLMQCLSPIDLRPSQTRGQVSAGAAVEYLSKQVAMASARWGNEYLTPLEVCELMVNLMAPQDHEDLGDPACGTGQLLAKCGQWVRDHGESNRYTLNGQDKNGRTLMMAKLNLYLHGERALQLAVGDTLQSPRLLTSTGQLQRFDVVVSNPPISSSWDSISAEHDPFSRFARGIPPNSKADYAFISHMLETLKPGTGRMAVLVPNGVLFRGGAEGKIREQLIEENLIDAVISLPAKLLYSTGIPIALMLLRKKKTDEHVLFVDASRQFQPGKSHNSLGPDNIQWIVETCKRRQNVKGAVHLACIKEISSHGYSLNVPLYVSAAEERDVVDLTEIRAERAALQAELASLEGRWAQCLREARHV